MDSVEQLEIQNPEIKVDLSKLKKPRKALVKKTIKSKSEKIESNKDLEIVIPQKQIQQIQLEETKQETKQETQILEKQKIILSFDPGFLKMGMACIKFSDSSLLETRCIQLRPEKTKLTQTQAEAQISCNLQKLFNELYNKYDIQYVVIELQLGNFSCTQVQTALVNNLKLETFFVIQHSKLKLKHPEISQIQNENTESVQYNQNKHKGRLLAQLLYKEFKEDNFDQCDALLHALYVFRNLKTIKFVKKQDFM